MVTLNEFINQNNGKYISLLQPGKQCFDLAVKWTDNLGVSHYPNNPSPFPVIAAYQIYVNFSSWQAQYFTLIPNPPVGGPQAGDIVVFSYYYNYAGGHVVIATGKGVSTGATSDWFEGFSQNDPTGSPCILKNYNFNYVLGWLRPKNLTVPLTDSQFRSQVYTWAKDTTIPDPDFRRKVLAI